MLHSEGGGVLVKHIWTALIWFVRKWAIEHFGFSSDWIIQILYVPLKWKFCINTYLCLLVFLGQIMRSRLRKFLGPKYNKINDHTNWVSQSTDHFFRFLNLLNTEINIIVLTYKRRFVCLCFVLVSQFTSANCIDVYDELIQVLRTRLKNICIKCSRKFDKLFHIP